jgi:23S rRNA (cytidine2498-2'-O)-methyltransferase
MLPAVNDLFWFATCRPGAEGVLKSEVALLHPELRSAYQRRGFVTFKGATDASVCMREDLGAAFARVTGLSLGRAETAAEVIALISAVPSHGPRVLHVFPRETPKDAAALASCMAACAALRRKLLATEPASWVADREVASVGETVIDVVFENDHELFVGAHLHNASRGAHAGGGFGVVVPADSPSRAFAKIEEVIAWTGIEPKVGERALEIGASPGGAAYALARRGVNVLGVDPGVMDPVVLRYRHASGAHVEHLKVALGSMTSEQIPRGSQWLLVDVHLAPPVMLHKVRRLIPPLRPTLRAAVFTLKLNEWSLASELPRWVEQVRGYGFSRVRARQLPSHRQELCLVAEP